MDKQKSVRYRTQQPGEIAIRQDEHQHIKDLMSRFYRAQAAAKDVTKLRKELVGLLKTHQMTDARFNFADCHIQYASKSERSGITQAHIRAFLREQYPDIDSTSFVKELYAAQPYRTSETLAVIPKGVASSME